MEVIMQVNLISIESSGTNNADWGQITVTPHIRNIQIIPKTGKTQKQVKGLDKTALRPIQLDDGRERRKRRKQEAANKEEAPVVHGPDMDLDGDGRSGSLGSSGSLSSKSGMNV